jgi:hypothetical protein
LAYWRSTILNLSSFLEFYRDGTEISKKCYTEQCS